MAESKDMSPIRGVRACVFDAYGTLFDFTAAARSCRDVLGEDIDRLTALWRDKQLQYTWLRAAQGRHADFWQVTGDALDFSLETLGLDTMGLRDRLMRLYLTLDPFAEVSRRPRHIESGRHAHRDPVERFAGHARRGSQGGSAGTAARCGALCRRGRGLQAAPESVPARRGSARHSGVGNRVPIVERVGCPCGVGVRDAGGLVQPLRPAPRTPARVSRSRGPLAGRAPALVGVA